MATFEEIMKGYASMPKLRLTETPQMPGIVDHEIAADIEKLIAKAGEAMDANPPPQENLMLACFFMGLSYMGTLAAFRKPEDGAAAMTVLTDKAGMTAGETLGRIKLMVTMAIAMVNKSLSEGKADNPLEALLPACDETAKDVIDLFRYRAGLIDARSGKRTQ